MTNRDDDGSRTTSRSNRRLRERLTAGRDWRDISDADGTGPDSRQDPNESPASVDGEQPPDDLVDTHESWRDERREAIGLPVEAETDDDTEPEVPFVLEQLGQVGVYVALLGLGLAVFGVGAAFLNIQPLGNVSMFFSLVLVTVAMLFAVAIQAYSMDFSLTSG